MNVYFDTEFTGLHKYTSLISLGLITDTNKELYLEFTDYIYNQCDEWIQKNVIDNTIFLKNGVIKDSSSLLMKDNCICSNSENCKNYLKQWLGKFNEPIQLISDVCHYDMVLFIDLFGNAFDLPDFISPVCHDISQDIARFLNISDREAFDINREDFVQQYGKFDAIDGNKHNSLYDAKIIKVIYDICNK